MDDLSNTTPPLRIVKPLGFQKGVLSEEKSNIKALATVNQSIYFFKLGLSVWLMLDEI